MAAILEKGDEWIVEPEPIVAPVLQPEEVPAEAPLSPVDEPVGVG